MTDDADRIAGLYERHAADFDRERGRTLFERGWLDRFRSLAPAGTGILDVGCGMAEPIARYLIDKGHTITGVDSSPSLIALCRARFPEHTWLAADMRHLALGWAFGGIIAWDSFFHLCADDQRAMFPVFQAHAGPATVLMFTSGPRAGVAMGSYHGEPLFHASLAPEEYRTLLADAGFDVVAYAPEDPDCGGHTIWLARRR